jgi:hypothetical protein
VRASKIDTLINAGSYVHASIETAQIKLKGSLSKQERHIWYKNGTKQPKAGKKSKSKTR